MSIQILFSGAGSYASLAEVAATEVTDVPEATPLSPWIITIPITTKTFQMGC